MRPPARRALKTVLQWILGIMFVAGGIIHFANPDPYVAIMPPYLPGPLTLVYVSGVAEVVLGVLLLIPRFQRIAAWGLIALLIAVFPANIHMALHPELFPEFPSVFHWLRLPLQGAFIAWAYWFTQRDSIR